MPKVSEEVHIDAPPERVWDVITDPQRIPEYNVTIVEVTEASGRLDEVGARYTAVAKIYGRRLEGTWETTEVLPGRRLVARGSTPGGGQASVISTVEPADGGTRAGVEIEYELPAGFLGAVANKLFVERAVERDVRHSGENLKALAESQR